MAKIVCSEPLWWIITSQLAGFFKDKKSEKLATIYPKSFLISMSASNVPQRSIKTIFVKHMALAFPVVLSNEILLLE